MTLQEKIKLFPHSPGVYRYYDAEGNVIYVGKAKKLKNRVSQYFQDTASHSPKTRIMVSHIHHFDVIVAASEFEALVLECSLIKRYSPKYNIPKISPRPIFIIHGRRDNIVPGSQARMLYKKAKDPKEMWIVPGATHNKCAEVGGYEYKQRLADFFREHL